MADQPLTAAFSPLDAVVSDGHTAGGRGLRSDDRRNHRGDETRLLSGPVRVLTPEEITTMQTNQPTTPKRTIVDPAPTVPDSIDRSLEMVQESIQATLRALHRKATKELQLLDDKELSALNIINTILVRIKKADEDPPITQERASQMTAQEIEKELAKRG